MVTQFSTGHGMCITLPVQLLEVFVWLEINRLITISLQSSMSAEVLQKNKTKNQGKIKMR
jgi:hypothetical protein